ncbi:MAG: hypothetical protein OEX00_01930 [Gammaproteobacteria bacterium]|nr:hypothetical protein [Gammaproteobacteria bacterium]MDH5693913.1 hypothetical protein [Gammaproteobacteria bacterium]
MLERVSHYCNNFLNRLLTNKKPVRRALLFDEQFLVTTHATIVYNADHFGYFGISADSGKFYYAVNADRFPRFLKDRLRVHVTLRYYPGVADFHRFGTVAKILSIEPSFEARPVKSSEANKK